MKAAQIKNYGGRDAIEINLDAEKPSLLQGQILVEVHSASLNRIDTAVRNGYLRKMMSFPLPLTLGGDFAGGAELVDTGKVKVQIEKTFPFSEIKKAFDNFETQHPRGKIVVEIK